MSVVIKHNAKLWERRSESGSYFLIYCPACDRGHSYSCFDDQRRPNWQFNGNLDKPTFTPSMRVMTVDPETRAQTTVCHFHVTDGELRFCNDNPHSMNDKTIELPDIPEDYGF